MPIRNYQDVYVPQIAPTGASNLGLNQRSSKESKGVRLAHMQQTVSLLNNDLLGTTFLFFKQVPSDAKLKLLEIETDAFTGVNIHIGLYDPDTNTVVGTTNSLANALSLNAAANKQTPLDGLNAVTHENTDKCLFELAGETSARRRAAYDIVGLLNVNSPANAKITARAELVPAG